MNELMKELFGSKENFFGLLKGIIFVAFLILIAYFAGKFIALNVESIGYQWLFFAILWAIFYLSPAKSIYKTCKLVDIECNFILINLPICQEYYLDKLEGASNAPDFLIKSKLLIISTILLAISIIGAFIPIEIVSSVSINVLKVIFIAYMIIRAIYIYNLSVLVRGKVTSLIMCVIFPLQSFVLTTLNNKILQRQRLNN